MNTPAFSVMEHVVCVVEEEVALFAASSLSSHHPLRGPCRDSTNSYSIGMVSDVNDNHIATEQSRHDLYDDHHK